MTQLKHLYTLSYQNCFFSQSLVFRIRYYNITPEKSLVIIQTGFDPGFCYFSLFFGKWFWKWFKMVLHYLIYSYNKYRSIYDTVKML
jgi:hypothetical protein